MCDDSSVRKRVLIVDDHQPFRAVARKLLESAGYIVVGEAADAAQALAAVAADCPDAVLLDVQLPDRDGFAVASALGSILSERRFYWAVIAVFIAFVGANTSGEQVTKAVNRVLGTIVGILLGSLLAHAIGHSTWSLAVIVLALGFGVYFIRVSYALMVIGVTVMVSELYEQLGEFSNHLLLLRLEETAIGAVVAALAALLVFPVRTIHAVSLSGPYWLAR